MIYKRLLIIFVILSVTLYAQNIKKINNFNSPNEALNFIKKQPRNIQNRYDMLILKVQAYTANNDFDNALKSAQMLNILYPKSLEAKEMEANILFWKKEFDESIKILEDLYKKTKNRYYLDRSYIVKNAKLEFRTENNNKINEQNNENEKHIEVGFEHNSYSDRRYQDQKEYIQAKFPYLDKTIVLTAENISKFNKNDKNIAGELYFKSDNKKWGFINVSASPTSNFMPKYTLGIHLYKGIDSIEMGLGYEYTKYPNQNAHTLMPEYRYYLPNNWYINQTLYYVINNKSFAILNKIGKEAEKKYKYHIGYIYGDSNEAIEAQDMFKNTTSNRFELAGELYIWQNWSIGSNLSKEYYKNNETGYKFNKSGAFIYLRRCW